VLAGIVGHAYAFDGDDDDDDDDDDGGDGEDDGDDGSDVIGDDDDDDDEVDSAQPDIDLEPEGEPESGDDFDAEFSDDDFASGGAEDLDGDNDDDDNDDAAFDATDSATAPALEADTPDDSDSAADAGATGDAATPDSVPEAAVAAGDDGTGAAAGSAAAESFGVVDPSVGADEFGADADFDFEPDEIVGVNLSSEERARARALGFTAIESHTLPQQLLELTRLEVPEDEDVASALLLLRSNVPGGYFDRNHRYRLAGGDPCVGIRCYGSRLIGWPRSDSGLCGAGSTIGIVDTAVDVSHSALPHDRIEVFRVAAGTNRDFEHGTAVATLLIGQPAHGVAGLLPRARLYAADAFRVDARGNVLATTVDLVRALDWLVAQKVDVINLSLAGPESDLLEIALARVFAAGIAVFAAAGNDGPTAPPPYPASDPNVIAVTAVDRFLEPYTSANRGAFIDLAAPGVRIWTSAGDGGRFVDGTSFASVYAAAAGALIHRASPSPHAQSTLAVLTGEARDLGSPGHDEVFGHGLLQSSAECAQ